MNRQLNRYSEYLVKTFQKEAGDAHEKNSSVNPIVSELSLWYEKMRNAIEYRDEEVVMRASIQRMLKRRLLMGATGANVAVPLVRELIWARYLPDDTVADETTKTVADIIDFYQELGKKINLTKELKKKDVNSLIFELMSSEIEQHLNPNDEEKVLGNYIYHILKDNVLAPEESEEDRDVQVFIAIRKAYAKDDIAFLRFHLFVQYFGKLYGGNISKIADSFSEAYAKIEQELNYKGRNKVSAYIKKQIPPFLILEDILVNTTGNLHEALKNEEELKKLVFSTSERKYSKIVGKVRRAIVRSVIFILLSKVFFAFSIEGTYESLVYGQVQWLSIALNIIIPTLLMITVGIFIRTPNKDNSMRIYQRITTLLFDEEPKVGKAITLLENPQTKKSFLNKFFNFLWGATFIVSFGAIIFILSKLHFNIVSMGIFAFFLAIVTFLAYRIRITAREYNVEDRQGLLTPLIDFFFMPFARIGRYLTEGISQINILIFIIDFAIETPFKVILEFFEKWFFFLHTKREDLG